MCDHPTDSCLCAGGLTENDFILAAKIDKLDLNDLLRRKASYWANNAMLGTV